GRRGRPERDSDDMVDETGEDHANTQDENADRHVVAGAESCDDDKQFAEENPERRKTGNAGEAAEKSHEGFGHALGQLTSALDRTAGIPDQYVAGAQKQGGFDQTVMDQAQHGPIGAQAADAGAESDDAHVFDAGIGQQALVLGLL